MEVFDLTVNPFYEFAKGWALVTAGKEGEYNTMTVSWGCLGILWNKNVCTVYIKPCRYTYEFLKNNDHFTVSFFPEDYRKDMALIGSRSGKDGDKVAMTKLTPVFENDLVTFKEARRTIVCKKIYSSQFVKEEVPSFAHDLYYTEEAEHYMFIGEILEIRGE